MPGYWRRPVARVYDYNLNVGESYYSPMRDYVSSERTFESPGPLTFGERIARTGLDNKESQIGERTEMRSRYSNARTEARERGALREAIRATSEIRRNVVDDSYSDVMDISRKSVERADSVLKEHRRMVRGMSADTQKAINDISGNRHNDIHLGRESCRSDRDSLQKRITDIRMSPWRTDRELEDDYKTSQESRARLYGLERELGAITRNAMTFSSNEKSAKEMAEEAHKEESSLSKNSYKSKRIIYESNRKIMNC